MTKKVIETEGFGVSYDRFMIRKLQLYLTKKYGIKSALEMPSFGVKASGGIYSIGMGSSATKITVTDKDIQALDMWKSLKYKITVSPQKSYSKTEFKPNSFDLVWNFVSFSLLKNKKSYFKEVYRVSRKYALIVSCNNFQVGYPWHRLLHRIYGIKWNHGTSFYGYPWNLKKELIDAGFKKCEVGTIDSPPWPDPVGFRDIRLHRLGGESSCNKDIKWNVPFVEFLKDRKFPFWMRFLGVYDFGLRKGYWKLPVSHLFYIWAQK